MAKQPTEKQVKQHGKTVWMYLDSVTGLYFGDFPTKLAAHTRRVELMKARQAELKIKIDANLAETADDMPSSTRRQRSCILHESHVDSCHECYLAEQGKSRLS